MPASWEYRQKPSGGHVCVVKIDNRVVSTAVAETKTAARDEAARQTVDKLMKRCYTVAVRDKFVTDGTTVNADDVQVATELGYKVGPKLRELAARGSQDAGFTQPRDPSFAHLCSLY